MRLLLDTNIVIHRESNIVSNYSIGHLFRWIDKLKYTKTIHPYTINEINKYHDSMAKEVFLVKLESYETIKTIKTPDDDFLSKIKHYKHNSNDTIDNYLLYEVYLGRVDILITEDRKMLRKAISLGIKDKVLSINQFISIATANNPEMVDYKMLSVRKEYFGNINLSSPFFDSFKRDYKEFEQWFNKKSNKVVYVCEDEGLLLGLLYLKIENEEENYYEISPLFEKAKRLKVGTFKVESTGFRLGERFIKIIFDNAMQYNVNEIYVTLFKEREELVALFDLLKRWGFTEHGIKRTANGEETVLVKKLDCFNESWTTQENFPNLDYRKQKFILPIYDKYHTTLLPDSKLNTEKEENFLEMLPHRYALQKVYISWSPERNINPGDFLLFYRPGEYGSIKKYTSVITTVGIVENILYNFKSKDDFLQQCQNRSVFSEDELNMFWNNYKNKLMVIKFIYVNSLVKRLNLDYLWQNNIITPPNGPRPFTRISTKEFNMILKDSDTNLIYYQI